MTITRYQWTLERDHEAIAAGLFTDQPVELLCGDIVVMAPEREPHAFLSDCFAKLLQRRQSNRAQIREGKPITLPNASEPEPDIAVVQPRGEVYFDHHPYPEDIFWLTYRACFVINQQP
jgi:Uma2 family endonuclease